MKVTIRIHRNHGVKEVTRKIEEDGKVTLSKGKKGTWRPLVAKVEPKIVGRFGSHRYYTEVDQDAEETYIVTSKVKAEEHPKWDKKQSQKFIDAKMLEKLGEEIKTGPSSLGLAAIGILIVVMGIIQILIVSGRLRI